MPDPDILTICRALLKISPYVNATELGGKIQYQCWHCDYVSTQVTGRVDYRQTDDCPITLSMKIIESAHDEVR